jgi:hypothetical protein
MQLGPSLSLMMSVCHGIIPCCLIAPTNPQKIAVYSMPIRQMHTNRSRGNAH